MGMQIRELITKPNSMTPPTIFSRCFRSDGNGPVIATAIALALVGCASAPKSLSIEPSSIAEKLGFPGCEISVALNPSEVVDLGRKMKIYPDPTEDPEWGKMIAIRQPGDQIRRVSCSAKNVSSYILVRNEGVIFKLDV